MNYGPPIINRISHPVARKVRKAANFPFLRACLCTLLCSLHADAATYYVDARNPSASDSAAGSLASPWKTIAKATATVMAGDRVIIKAGEYNEFVKLQQSGAAGSPISFVGERGPNGEWLTILDPSTAITNNWTAATDIGAGVWKYASLGFQPAELTIDAKRVAYVWTMGTITHLTTAWNNAVSLGLTTGTNVLTMATNLVVDSSGLRSWDGVEAIWGTVGSGNNYTVFLRQRDGSAPAGLNLRAVKDSPAIALNGCSYVVISNLWVRNSYNGIDMAGSNCHHVSICSNYITGGYSRILIRGSTAIGGAWANTISGNTLTANYYGYSDSGAWATTGTMDYAHTIRYGLYHLAKYIFTSQQTSWDDSIVLNNCGHSNTVSLNVITNGLGCGITLGVAVCDQPGGWYATNTTIAGNKISGVPSAGILLSEGQIGTLICSNQVSDCNFNSRFHHFGYENGARLVYFYRNLFWEPANYGTHIFFHGSANTNATWPTFYVYHNSFSGGSCGLGDNGYISFYNQLTNSWFLNNIFSGAKYFDSSTAAWVNAGVVGLFDYNLVTPPYPTYPNTNFPAWFGAHNRPQSAAQWTNAQAMTFKLAAGSAALDAAIDVSRPFVIGGVTYPALPVGKEVKVGTAWDIGALEYGLHPPPAVWVTGSTN